MIASPRFPRVKQLCFCLCFGAGGYDLVLVWCLDFGRSFRVGVDGGLTGFFQYNNFGLCGGLVDFGVVGFELNIWQAYPEDSLLNMKCVCLTPILCQRTVSQWLRLRATECEALAVWSISPSKKKSNPSDDISSTTNHEFSIFIDVKVALKISFCSSPYRFISFHRLAASASWSRWCQVNMACTSLHFNCSGTPSIECGARHLLLWRAILETGIAKGNGKCNATSCLM